MIQDILGNGLLNIFSNCILISCSFADIFCEDWTATVHFGSWSVIHNKSYIKVWNLTCLKILHGTCILHGPRQDHVSLKYEVNNTAIQNINICCAEGEDKIYFWSTFMIFVFKALIMLAKNISFKVHLW
jgi:hypothetical protein